MAVAWFPDYSFPVGSLNVVLPFVITVPDGVGGQVLLSHAGSATVTWFSPDNTQRVLSAVLPESATFQWTVSAREFTTPRMEIGRCRVSTSSGGVLWTSAFIIAVTPQF